MQGLIRVSAIILALLGSALRAEDAPEQTEVVISVAEQKMVLLRDGMWVQKFPVSTSKFGLGDTYGSYKTPLGRLRVCGKIGDGLPSGAVMRHRNATGEILPVNARGRDPIVTRIIWLEGLEACNERARGRGIYIHGTVEESKIGKPVSYGCVRMRSTDVVSLFNELPMGATVTIQEAKLPKLKRWSPPPPPTMIVTREPAKEKEQEKEPVKLAKVEPAPKPEESRPEPEKVERKAPALASHQVPEKVAPSSIPTRSSSPVLALAANRSAAGSEAAEAVAPAPMKTSLVIRSSGAIDESRLIPADAGAAALLKESVLFADLPK